MDTNTNTNTTSIQPAPVAQPAPAQPAPALGSSQEPESRKQREPQVQVQVPRLADAIAVVLIKGGGEMGAADIAKKVLESGLWPADKSKDLPKAAWNAIVLEIKKGDSSRFVKRGKGKYAHRPTRP